MFARTFIVFGLPVRQVGRLLHYLFEACSAFTHVNGLHARRVAYATFYTKASAASLLRCCFHLLPGGAN